nr:DUF4279 domain-containing protein [Paraurantiacibacter namhicola]
MGRLRESAATVGFYGDDLDPHEITGLLGMEPTIGVAKGGRWATSPGAEKIAHTGSWRLKANRCEPENLSRQIDELLASLTKDLGVWRDLNARFRGVLFCGLWLNSYNDGLEIEPKVLGAIAERGLALDLDIYESSID